MNFIVRSLSRHTCSHNWRFIWWNILKFCWVIEKAQDRWIKDIWKKKILFSPLSFNRGLLNQIKEIDVAFHGWLTSEFISFDRRFLSRRNSRVVLMLLIFASMRIYVPETNVQVKTKEVRIPRFWLNLEKANTFCSRGTVHV